eukprot:gnl/MRDRNA2_/MRDRNA2_85512_c0_seq2.p1 gnl/MRDRNA2_/MRDRNA2_85512_c0~~gnl/MRDRNA2_/MRDRNA2_85512_c0_seq2.p1  ORF type:complete len:613 (-),score=61.53 gnl/MRDRNA2_/MRDRNA2_85512_c0_seq2:356-2194(-)
MFQLFLLVLYCLITSVGCEVPEAPSSLLFKHSAQLIPATHDNILCQDKICDKEIYQKHEPSNLSPSRGAFLKVGGHKAKKAKHNSYLNQQREDVSMFLRLKRREEGTQFCWSAMLLAAGLFIILFQVPTLMWLEILPVCKPSDRTPVSTARSLQLFLRFQNAILFSIVILDSYRIAMSIGRGAVYSGFLIGANGLGMFAGCAVAWLFMRRYPHIWRTPCMMFLPALCCNFVGQTLFTTSIFLIHSWKSPEQVLALQWMLIVARVITGLGAGLLEIPSRHIITHTAPPSERPEEMQRYFLWQTTGMGVGPLAAALAAVIFHLMPCSTQVAGLGVMAAIALVIPVIALGSLMCMPSLESVADFDPPDAADALEDPVGTKSSEKLVRYVVLVCALLHACGRAFFCSSLEAATSLLFEVEFQWDPRAIGLVTSFNFLCTSIFKVIHDASKEHATLNMRIRMLYSFTLLGSILMIPSVCFFRHADCAWVLLAADCTAFPCFYLVDGLMQGILYNHAFPRGSFLDSNNLSLLTVFLNSVVGRFLGPPVARWNVQRGGQFEYALWQIAICCAAIMSMELALYLGAGVTQKGEPSKEKQEERDLGDVPSHLRSPRTDHQK